MKNYRGIYKGAALSALWHMFFGLLVCLIIFKYGKFNCLPSNKMESIITNVSSISAQIGFTLAGFVLATTAIFAAFSDKPLIKSMNKSGHSSVIILRMLLSIGYSFALSMTGVYFLFFPNSNLISIFILAFVVVFCISSLIDILKKFWRILSYINNEDHSNNNNDDGYENIDQTPKMV